MPDFILDGIVFMFADDCSCYPKGSRDTPEKVGINHKSSLSSNYHLCETRPADTFVTDSHKKSIFEKLFSFCTNQIIPTHIRNMNILQFKKTIKTIICKHAFYILDEYFASSLSYL